LNESDDDDDNDNINDITNENYSILDSSDDDISNDIKKEKEKYNVITNTEKLEV